MEFKYEVLSPTTARRPHSLLYRYRHVIMVFTILALWFSTALSFGAAMPFNVAKFSSTASPWAPLRFDKDGKFQLAIFEDLHFGESEWSARRIDGIGC